MGRGVIRYIPHHVTSFTSVLKYTDMQRQTNPISLRCYKPHTYIIYFTKISYFVKTPNCFDSFIHCYFSIFTECFQQSINLQFMQCKQFISVALAQTLVCSHMLFNKKLCFCKDYSASIVHLSLIHI